MRILIDHCVDWRFCRSLPRHDVKSARQMGWDELTNGKLLAEAAAQFDVMITVDRNLRSEQNLAALPIAVIVLVAHSNKLDDLTPLAPLVENALEALTPKTLVEVSERTT